MKTHKTITTLCIVVMCILLPATGTTASDQTAQETYSWMPTNSNNMQSCIKAEKRYAKQVNEQLNINLTLYETDYFLLYTDLPKNNATHWRNQLDSMYKKLIRLLKLPHNYNIWAGKASIYLFNKKQQFIEFEKTFYKNKITFEAALCHQHYTGEVRLALYSLKDQLFMQQLFIHETMHGIIHRYKTSVRIPTWLNEGISEWAANQILGDAPSFRTKKLLSKNYLQKIGYLPSDFFSDYRFKPEFYGIALELTRSLMSRSQDNFIYLLTQIKNKKPWHKALKSTNDITPEELILSYAHSIGLEDLPIEIPSSNETHQPPKNLPQSAIPK
ncbi:hypothetical protein KS4_29060 [Poriferisphaera corsica]|uniref:DUF1570 domain-containing protein n=1 Tax=Poriferisphaera corsica TaxID=2528020 RepID=A0A517YX86_9BACT|nr:hypothetical protein [Poriferisphaera corsica]QDU34830.1 hypothetical protein KS4_29060 [Poriferisphaera corsica]